MLKSIAGYGGLVILALTGVVIGMIVLFHADVAGTGTVAAQTSHDHSGHSMSRQPEKERRIKHWVAPMDPTYIRDKPGKSPMGMDLIPVYEDGDETSSGGGIRIDPVTVQNIGVRTAKVSRGIVSRDIRTVGQITYDEKRVEHIHTKVPGWIEKLYVDTTGQEVRAGEPILSFYSPDLVATQQEYLQVVHYRKETAQSPFPEVAESGRSMVEAARKRLLYMDISPSQIEELEKSGEVKKGMTMFASKPGIVINKNVLEGMRIDPSMELYTIADLSRVWAIASVYEYEIPLLQVGQEVEMTLPYDPGIRYSGKVTFIYPFLSSKTRTARVRMEFDNPGLRLKPDMYADVLIRVRTGAPSLLVPSESVLRTGSRSVVIASLGEGRFIPREVTTGWEGEGMTQVLSGIEEGETIVTSGQFLIDSESNLREVLKRMIADQAGADAEAGAKEKKPEVNLLKAEMKEEQKKRVAGLIDNYTDIHASLVADDADGVVRHARDLSEEIREMTEGDHGQVLQDITGPIRDSLRGLLSGDLQNARDSFRLFSGVMIGFMKGPGKDFALASGMKLYYCPMADERWIQKEGDLMNPYFGKDMLNCGTEEKIID